eukprot:TRINITY_DN6826_c0_g1_i2.p1 TRINITY_DN6826_c0_g1~~TRINITY_DN6826_c0_g1_i2.p1  ORF type:complete len:969 (+),score=291.98 TRINITY_DN6826_c0_g1_i2:74-2980(+)
MNTSWGSPFKFNDLMGAAVKTIKTVESRIDKAIGIPEQSTDLDAAKKSPRATEVVTPISTPTAAKIVDEPNFSDGLKRNASTTSLSNGASPASQAAMKRNSSYSAPTAKPGDDINLEELLNQDIVPKKAPASRTVKSSAVESPPEVVPASTTPVTVLESPLLDLNASTDESQRKPEVIEEKILDTQSQTFVTPLSVSIPSSGSLPSSASQDFLMENGHDAILETSPNGHLESPKKPLSVPPSPQESTWNFENDLISSNQSPQQNLELNQHDSFSEGSAQQTLQVSTTPEELSETAKEARSKLSGSLSEGTYSEPELAPSVVTSPQEDPKPAASLPSSTSFSSVSGESAAVTLLEQKLATLSLILKDRERQLESFTLDNSSLREENESLRRQLESSNASGNNADLESMKEEFSKRLGDLERKHMALKKERDELKKAAGQPAAAESISSDVAAAKDKQISQLIEEGEKLAKRQLSLEASVKKYKTLNTEHEKTIKSLKDRLQNTENLLEQKIAKLKELEDSAKRYSENITNMKDISEATSKQLEERKRSFESVQNQFTDLQTALEKAWVEIADQKKLYAAAQSKAADMVLEAEARVKQEHQQYMARYAQEATEREATLLQQIKELRATIARQNERAAWREDELGMEIQNLKAKIQASEGRNEEIVSSVPEATRPLLRQIEILQASNAERIKVWEEVERSLTNRLNEAEERGQQAIERERNAVAQMNELVTKIRMLESEQSTARNANARLSAEFEMERVRAEEKERELSQVKAQLAVIQSSHDRVIHELRQNELNLQSLLGESRDREERTKQELMAVTNEKKRLEKEKLAQIPTSSTPQIPRSSSVDGMTPAFSSSGTLPPIEKYQSLLKQKDGEISSLQVQNGALEKNRALLQDELVKVTSRCEQLSSEVNELQDLRTKIQELGQRYNTALELIGEKEEQVEELKHDIADMKTMYKTQINELLIRIETSR